MDSKLVNDKHAPSTLRDAAAAESGAPATSGAPFLAEPSDLRAAQIRAAVADGRRSAAAEVETRLDVIARRDPAVRAVAHIEPRLAAQGAEAVDAAVKSGRVGALAGVPILIKDIIDTADLPTENGTAADAGRRPKSDAAVVSRLRGAGAVILAKSVSTELAYFAPGPTRNPWDLARTPGGSSSGSAAGVAAGLAPVAIGTQTAGSVIRPAAFCGVVGYKPSFGAIPRTGVLTQAPPLDTVGVFARSVRDAALVAEAAFGPDPGDPASARAAPAALTATLSATEAATPSFAFVETPFAADADPAYRALLATLARSLGAACRVEPAPERFASARDAHRLINMVSIAHHFVDYAERAWEKLSPQMHAAIEEGRAASAVRYLEALAAAAALRAEIAPTLKRYDAIMTLASLGEAPSGLEATGDPRCNAVWTLIGAPCVTLPIGVGPGGVPLGVQLVGAVGGDARLLGAAAWLEKELSTGVGLV